MKYVLALASLLLLAAPAMAFGPGNVSGTWEEGVVREGVSTGVKAGSEAGINDRFKKENCHFVDDKTETKIQCKSGGIDWVTKYLSDWRSGLENSVANSVNVTIRAHAKDSKLADKRANYVRDQVHSRISWWNYYVDGTKAGNNDLNINVKVR
jgi:hypothetical protein